MEKITNFLKSKSLGYYFVAGIALLSLVFGIVFFATSKGTFPNSAASIVTDTIGIYLLITFVIEVVVLIFPQYRFVHLVAIFMLFVSFATEALIFAPLVADKVNNVAFQHGDFGYHLFFTIIILVLIALSIAASFLGFYKSEEELAKDMKVNPSQLVKIVAMSACAVIVIGSVVAGSIVTDQMAKNLNKAGNQEVEEDDPYLTEEIKAICKEKMEEYDYNPENVIIKQQEEYDYNDADLKALGYGDTRTDHHLIYAFEGQYAEGYQGDYSPTYGSIYLWDDGLFGGTIRNTNIRGYWYNSSLEDTGVDADGNNVKDGVIMVSNISKYEYMKCDDVAGFYDLSTYAYLDMGWGTRSMSLYGYYYYPNATTFIKYKGTEDFKVGDTLVKGNYTTQRVLANTKYTSVLKTGDVTWTWPSGMLDSNDKFIADGEFEIKSKWGNFNASRTITVKPAEEAPAE